VIFTGAAVVLASAGPSARAADCTRDAGLAADRDYQQGLAEYRAGQVEASYPLLRGAYAVCPTNTRYRNDLILAATGAGHAAEALEIGAALEPAALPVYVLEALARAARDTHQPDLAVRYYDVILGSGENIGASVGRDLAQIDRGNAREAQADLQSWRARHPERVDVLEALGLADEALGETVPALAAAEVALAINPQHAGAQRLRFRMLTALGAPQLALALTPESLVSPGQRGWAMQDALALEFRWARDGPGNDRLRAPQLDQLIQRMRAAIADPEINAEARAAIRRDLIEALAERGRAAEAVSEYEKLSRDGVMQSPSTTAAAVGAYLDLRQPQRSIELYRSLPPDSQRSFGTGVDYFYALLESGQYTAAVAWADELAARQPMYFDADAPALRSENPDYAGARVLAAMARAYTDRFGEAYRRLQALLDVAPANRDAQLAMAETQSMRGWPRHAEQTANQVLQTSPDAVGPLPKILAAQLDMDDGRAARRTLERIQAVLPPDNGVRERAERDWRNHNAAEFGIIGQLGHSYGGRPGVIDSSVEEYAYTRPIAWDYRLFARLNQAEGTPVQGTTTRHAIGAGLEYRTRNWLATAELLVIEHDPAAPQLSLEATPDDHWRAGLSYEYRTLDTPIAATVVGVHADRLALHAGYRSSESRDFGVSASHERYSDSNSRFEQSGYWSERWITGPVYKLATVFDLDASTNTLAGTNYYNPLSDFSAAVTWQNQWLQFRRYDRALTHAFDLGVGSYSQQGYGAGSIALLHYQLIYDVSDRLALKAGVGRTWRPYDGERERVDMVNFSLIGRY
jgi:biofilm PGA synthesis protein PgaA